MRSDGGTFGALLYSVVVLIVLLASITSTAAIPDSSNDSFSGDRFFSAITKEPSSSPVHERVAQRNQLSTIFKHFMRVMKSEVVTRLTRVTHFKPKTPFTSITVNFILHKYI